ncbi:MAG: hypothetical protein IJ925_02370 [Muribaculaceae bacterium]|nr:hypothetical protein [Muribaculaceae bacterium]
MLALLVMIATASCNRGPKYIYVDMQGDEPKVSFIEADEDDVAYDKAFETYSTTRFYPLFSDFEKMHRYMADNGNSEACEGDDGMVVPPDDSNGAGAVITTGDDVTSVEGNEPLYEELDKLNSPNFVLYKITDSSARKAAQDYIDKKITYEELEKTLKGNTEQISLYEKRFEHCVAIDRSVFDKLRNKLRATIAQIDREVAARKAELEADSAANNEQ